MLLFQGRKVLDCSLGLAISVSRSICDSHIYEALWLLVKVLFQKTSCFTSSFFLRIGLFYIEYVEVKSYKVLLFVQNWHDEYGLGCPLPRMPFTARIIIFLVRDPYEPSFATGTGGGTIQNMLHQFLPMSLLGNRHQNHTWPNHDFEFPANSPSTFLPYLHRQLSVPILWCACMPARLMICRRPSKIQHGSNQLMFRKNLAANTKYRYFPGIRYLQYIFQTKKIWGCFHFYAQKDMEHQSGEVSSRWLLEPKKCHVKPVWNKIWSSKKTFPK